MDDLKERSDTETILLVAHNGIARAVHSYFYDMTNEEFAAFGMKKLPDPKIRFLRRKGKR